MSIAHSGFASWAIDPWPLRAAGLIVKNYAHRLKAHVLVVQGLTRPLGISLVILSQQQRISQATQRLLPGLGYNYKLIPHEAANLFTPKHHSFLRGWGS